MVVIPWCCFVAPFFEFALAKVSVLSIDVSLKVYGELTVVLIFGLSTLFRDFEPVSHPPLVTSRCIQ